MAPAGPRGNPSDVSPSASALLSSAPPTAILTTPAAVAPPHGRLLAPLIVLLPLPAGSCFLEPEIFAAAAVAPGCKKPLTESESRSATTLARERATAVVFIVRECSRRWGGGLPLSCDGKLLAPFLSLLRDATQQESQGRVSHHHHTTVGDSLGARKCSIFPSPPNHKPCSYLRPPR